MTIRKTLLISYLLISIASTLIISVMIFTYLRHVLQTEIENKLTSQSLTIMHQIDTSLFERMENVSIWSHLAVMQEVQIRDIDKRVSRLLTEFHSGYDGVYRQLFVTTPDHEIVAASDASLLGEAYKPASSWLSFRRLGVSVELQEIEFDRRRLLFSTAIPDQFQTGSVGRLYAGFNWDEIRFLLNGQSLENDKTDPILALLVDQSGRVIARSSALNRTLSPWDSLPAEWLQGARSGSLQVKADFMNNQTMLIGYALSSGYQNFTGFGWRVLVFQPMRQAFAPLWHIWMVSAVFLGVTLLLGVVVSFWMSSRIAKPIVRLAEVTRDFMHGHEVHPPLEAGSQEIKELSMTFAEMIENLEQSRQDLVRIAKLAVIGEMAASMAHEVRTPLGILRSSAQMLQREGQLSAIGQEMTGFIISETERLNTLVCTLLECARPKPPDFVQYDLHILIDHVLELLAAQADKKQIRLVACYTPDESWIMCDKNQLIQVFLNLVMNAIQHVPEKGVVRVILNQADGGFRVDVCDSGKGIADAEKSSIFEPFFTRREGGIGLGLTVVQQNVLAHQGRIEVCDSPLGGVCFKVFLPKNMEMTSE